jgi:transcription elongation GreA/GreB family factor
MTERFHKVKEELLRHCKSAIEKRIREVRLAMDALRSSASEETKSSAGDKYETGREMIQQELDKYAQTLNEAVRQMKTLEKLNINSGGESIHMGSLVKTDQGSFFIAVSSAPLVIAGEKVLPVSASSPIGLKLLDMKLGQTFTLNGRNYKVTDVY